MVNADDPEWDEYKCPPMLGAVVTVSGLDSADRVQVKQLVEAAGTVPPGIWTGQKKSALGAVPFGGHEANHMTGTRRPLC